MGATRPSLQGDTVREKMGYIIKIYIPERGYTPEDRPVGLL